MAIGRVSRPRAYGVVFAGCVLVAGGCAGDDADSARADTSPTTTTIAPTVASSLAPTTVPATTIAPTTVAPTTEPVDPYGAWCAIAVEADERIGDGSVFEVIDPAELEAQIDEIRELSARASLVVPDEIADAWAASLALSVEVQEAIADAGYDVLTADFAAIAELEDDGEAGERLVEEFNAEHCGTEPPLVGDDDDDDDGGFDFAAGSLKDQFIDSLTDRGFSDDEALCVFDAYDFTAIGTQAENLAIAGALATCDIAPERLVDAGVEPDDADSDE